MLNRRRTSENHSRFSYEIRPLEASVYFNGNEAGSFKFPSIGLDPAEKLELVETFILILAESYDPPLFADEEDESDGLFDYEDEEDDFEDSFVGDGMDGEEWERMLCQFGRDEDL